MSVWRGHAGGGGGAGREAAVALVGFAVRPPRAGRRRRHTLGPDRPLPDRRERRERQRETEREAQRVAGGERTGGGGRAVGRRGCGCACAVESHERRSARGSASGSTRGNATAGISALHLRGGEREVARCAA